MPYGAISRAKYWVRAMTANLLALQPAKWALPVLPAHEARLTTEPKRCVIMCGIARLTIKTPSTLTRSIAAARRAAYRAPDGPVDPCIVDQHIDLVETKIPSARRPVGQLGSAGQPMRIQHFLYPEGAVLREGMKGEAHLVHRVATCRRIAIVENPGRIVSQARTIFDQLRNAVSLLVDRPKPA